MTHTPIDSLTETDMVRELARDFLRSANQKNAIFESDAELVSLGSLTLAITTDTLAEEIDMGLYHDPYQIGWMAVTVNASDLAAVGAEPLGLLISESLTSDLDTAYLHELQRGIDEASRAIDLPILGGDTNVGRSLSITGTAIGCIQSGPIVTRVGAEVGDLLFTSGRLGAGNAYAARVLGLSAGGRNGEIECYLPKARIREGQLMRQFASSAMDTSDGAFATLFQLGDLNDLGFEIVAPLSGYLSQSAHSLQGSGIEPWMTLAGPHGEFELLFTIPPDQLSPFLAVSRSIDWQPILLGSAIEIPEYSISIFDKAVTLHPSQIRNFALSSQTDVQAMLESLRALELEWKEEYNVQVPKPAGTQSQ